MSRVVTHDGIFTGYVRALEINGEPPDTVSFEAAWGALRGALHWELRRRGMWYLAPSYLGVDGFDAWADPESRAGGARRYDALDELTADCYAHVFVRRIASLRSQLHVKPNVDGLVFLNGRHFVQDRQARHDPLGTRIFSLLRSVIRQALKDGRLHVIGGDVESLGRTVLAFDSEASLSVMASEADLRPLVERWNDDLLPELITTRGRGQVKLATRIRLYLDDLPEHGIKAFAFRSLVDLMKVDVRGRWAAAYEITLGDQAFEILDRDGREIVPLVLPATAFEDRQGFRKLTECVRRSIADHPRSYGDLRAIWDLLVGWAAGPGPEEVSETQKTRTGSETAPSRRTVARRLGIPRDRMPRLYGMLGDIVRTCREAVRTAVGATPERAGGTRELVASPTSAGAIMDDLRERLRQATGRALERAARHPQQRQSWGPQAGDIYVLPGSSLPLEWVVLDLTAGDGALVVPADTRPFVGSADLALPDEVLEAPLTLRCGYAVTLPRRVLKPGFRTRGLASEHIALALDILGREAAGKLKISPLDEEVEYDPLYQEWLAEIAGAVRSVQALAAREPSVEQAPDKVEALAPATPAGMPRQWLEGLAAALAMVVMGLLAILWLRDPAAAPRMEPYVAPPVEPIVIRDPNRRSLTWRLGPTTEQLLLELVFLDPLLCENFRLEFLDDVERLLWARDNLDIPVEGEIKLVLPRHFLERGPGRLRFYGRCDGETRLLDERRLRVEFSSR